MTLLEKMVWAAVFGQVWELHRENSPPWKKMPEVDDVESFLELGHDDAIKQADRAVMDLRSAVKRNDRLHLYEELELERQAEEG